MQATATLPWWASENELTLREAAERSRRDQSTVFRWTTAGANGVRLRRFRRGPRGWLTTVEELDRFAQAQTAIAGGDA